MKKTSMLLVLSLLFCIAVTGCAEKEEYLPPATMSPVEAVVNTDTPVTETAQAQEQDEVLKFDYKPGSMGIYITADPNIEADPEVLDSITMTLSDMDQELTRHRVSDRQFDLIKNGYQAAGFVLVDIPREMLEKAPDSWPDFEAAADHIAKQVMPDIYPSGSYINGGGHTEYRDVSLPVYMTFMIEKDGTKPGTTAQYHHRIYIGEHYIYDFWFDQAWMADGGGTIMESLDAEDIKPELNEHEPWSIHDFPDNPWASKD